MRNVPMLGHRSVPSRIVVPLIKGQMLRRVRGGLGTINHDGVQCGIQQLGVVHIGGRYDDGQWTACALHQ